VPPTEPSAASQPIGKLLGFLQLHQMVTLHHSLGPLALPTSGTCIHCQAINTAVQLADPNQITNRGC